MAEAVVMVETWRGKRVESRHRGHAVVVNREGAVVAAWGNAALSVFPRSAIKALQALPLVESGALDRFRLPEPALALACGSHYGEPEHVSLVASILAAIGLGPEALACGAHLPEDSDAANALIRAGTAPSVLHNNCSGKHVGMLATARHCGDPVAGYEHRDHPVQRRIRAALEELANYPLPEDALAVDGCSVPTFALPLAALARAMVFLAGVGTAGQRQAPGLREQALARIAAAWGRHPHLIGGRNAFDSRVMALGPGILMKSGAEGIGVAILPTAGLACVVKIEDGSPRAKNVAMLALLHRLGVVDARSTGLAALAEPNLTNWAGRTVGAVRPAADWLTGWSERI